jgi:Rrf2 family transcriptional regulator, iron-sulfur cluster assembly transcription factor
MKLTRAGEYGIRGVMYLARQAHGRVTMLSAIAEAEHTPPLFLAKIFQALTKAGVVKSHRGAKGGFSLVRPAADITLKEVIEAIEGPIALNRDTRCPVQFIWEQAQATMLDVLARANFADLAKAGQPQAILTGFPSDNRASQGDGPQSRLTPISPASPRLKAPAIPG